MRKFFFITLFICAFMGWLTPKQQQEANAFEPVTLSLLAPLALEAASTATPYVIKWLGGVGKVFLKMGRDVFEVFLLPVGLLEAMFLFPFTGCFRQGCRFMLKGVIAPGKLVFHTLLLPFALCGLSLLH